MSEASGSLLEQLTQGFYEWEMRGRGWLVWDEPVGLEPPFRPFLGHGIGLLPAIDDGRQHTLLSRWTEKLVEHFRGKPPERPRFAIPEAWLEERLPDPEPDAPDFRELSAQLPRDVGLPTDALERWLVGLQLSGPASFELLGAAQTIRTGFTCREADATHFIDLARAYLPDLTLLPAPNRLVQAWAALPTPVWAVADFGLANEFMLPLAAASRLDPDPLAGAVAALESLGAGELGLLQVLFQPTREPWAESLLRAVRDPTGGPFFSDAPEILPAAKEKASRPLFAVGIRVAGAAPNAERAWEIARGLGGALSQLEKPLGNALIPLSDDEYPEDVHETDLYRRTTHRSGMLLNTAELATLVHVPGPGVRSDRLERLTRRTKAAPEFAEGVLLGANVHAGVERPVRLPSETRLRHVHVVGASGTGKSTLLLNLVLADIASGRGVGLFDPHGDLVDEILARIPEGRRGDVVLVDPGDPEHTVPFNVLAAHSEIERSLLASDLGAVFRRLATSWGDQMTTVLGNAIGAILEHPEGGTLVTLRRFLADKDFRRQYLAGVRDPELSFFWDKEFPILRGGSQASILTRLNTFLRPKPIRAMVSQTENRIDFARILDAGQIFLAKLSHGLVGQENAHLLGSLLVAKFQQTAIARQSRNPGERRPFFLVIDEFQNFVTPSMAAILSGARKYGLGLTLAHQDLRQLEGVREVAGLIQSAGARICFRLGDGDARSLESGFEFFTRQDLQSLGTGEAIARIERADQDFNLATFRAPEIAPEAAEASRRAAVAASRERHAVPILEPEPFAAPPAPVAQPTPPKPAPRSAPPARASEPVAPPSPDGDAPGGRGGAEHTYLQQLVARLGQDRGFRATLEAPIADGRVDVALERGEARIACEISVTSRPEYEAEKAVKCLQADFSRVLIVAQSRGLKRLEKAILARVGDDRRDRITFLDPEELPAFFDALGEGTSESVVRGYRVKVSHASDPQAAERKRRVAEVITRSLRRLKDEEGGS